MCRNCHVVTLGIEIKDLEALQEACQHLGWTFHEHQPHFRWVGRWYDDTPVPRHLFADEAEYQRVLALPRAARQTYMDDLLNNGCRHAISVPGCEAQIGVFEVNGTFQIAYDYYTDAQIQNVLGAPHLPNVVNPLPAAYAIERTRLEAFRQGNVCLENQLHDGSVQLRIQIEG